MQSNPHKLTVIDGETLMDKRLPPTKFCVDTLLPQGLCISISPSPRQTVINAVTTSSLPSNYCEKIWRSTISSAVVNRGLLINTSRM